MVGKVPAEKCQHKNPWEKKKQDFQYLGAETVEEGDTLDLRRALRQAAEPTHYVFRTPEGVMDLHPDPLLPCRDAGYRCRQRSGTRPSAQLREQRRLSESVMKLGIPIHCILSSLVPQQRVPHRGTQR